METLIFIVDLFTCLFLFLIVVTMKRRMTVKRFFVSSKAALSQKEAAEMLHKRIKGIEAKENEIVIHFESYSHESSIIIYAHADGSLQIEKSKDV